MKEACYRHALPLATGFFVFMWLPRRLGNRHFIDASSLFRNATVTLCLGSIEKANFLPGVISIEVENGGSMAGSLDLP